MFFLRWVILHLSLLKQIFLMLKYCSKMGSLPSDPGCSVELVQLSLHLPFSISSAKCIRNKIIFSSKRKRCNPRYVFADTIGFNESYRYACMCPKAESSLAATIHNDTQEFLLSNGLWRRHLGQAYSGSLERALNKGSRLAEECSGGFSHQELKF